MQNVVGRNPIEISSKLTALESVLLHCFFMVFQQSCIYFLILSVFIHLSFVRGVLTALMHIYVLTLLWLSSIIVHFILYKAHSYVQILSMTCLPSVVTCLVSTTLQHTVQSAISLCTQYAMNISCLSVRLQINRGDMTQRMYLSLYVHMCISLCQQPHNINFSFLSCQVKSSKAILQTETQSPHLDYTVLLCTIACCTVCIHG